MIHLLVGDKAANNLESAFELDENLKGKIFIIKDNLSVGDIQCSPEISHDEIRTSFWKTINPSFIEEMSEEKKLLSMILEALAEDEPVCLWMSACADDVCAYYWLLPYFKPYPQLLHTINIIGLPFLNEKGQLFYPTHFSQIPPKEFTKTKRLLKEISLSEYEVEVEEWSRFQSENKWIRIYEGGKKIISKDETFFDHFIKSSVTPEFQKANRIVNDVLKKMNHSIISSFIEYRLKQLLLQNVFSFTGNLEGPFKDVEVKIINEVDALELNV
ncbi:MAG TPA: DUF3658 domain-containing protein [Chitinophagaceae bacterium]|nr:MAG: hypothetical protein UZ11_BCD004001727 [Bacteroidetes bacterium OLB11]HMN32472.1 DUF3658 domain-containing protein [Chitinophagaceae bacterium]